LPTTLQVVRALAGQDITVIGFELIECFSTDTPESQATQEIPHDSCSGTIFDTVLDDHAGRYIVEAE
jgi:hypothetical protein